MTERLSRGVMRRRITRLAELRLLDPELCQIAHTPTRYELRTTAGDTRSFTAREADAYMDGLCHGAWCRDLEHREAELVVHRPNALERRMFASCDAHLVLALAHCRRSASTAVRARKAGPGDSCSCGAPATHVVLELGEVTP